MDEDENALRVFLKDINCLDNIEASIGKETVFDVLGMARNEIRHSRMLKWLLDPHGSHGLGTRFLSAFLQSVCKVGGDVFDLMMADLDTFRVYHEYKNIDILLVSNESKVVVAIENKVDSTEHGDQLSRYEKVVEADFPTNKFKRAFVFLTPDGSKASRENWLPVGYNPNIVEAIEYCREKQAVAPDAELIIEHYHELLRREFMKKDMLAEVCNKIYQDHKRALDLIFELKDDSTNIVRGMIDKWFERNGENYGLMLDKVHSSKAYIHFSTAKLERLVPLLQDGKESEWKSAHSAYYEIQNRENSVSLKLQFSSRNMATETIKTVERIQKPKSANWRYTSLDMKAKLNRKDGEANWEESSIEDFMKKVVKAVQDFESKKIP